MVVVKDSDETMDGGFSILIGTLDQIPNLMEMSRALCVSAADQIPNLMEMSRALCVSAAHRGAAAFQWAEHIHTAYWLVAAVIPKLWEISRKSKVTIRVDTPRGAVDVDAQNSTLGEITAKVKALTDDGDGG